MVAVGTRIAPRPPHRSRRALLTHRAPPSGRTSVAGGWKPSAVRRTAASRIDVVSRLSVRTTAACRLFPWVRPFPPRPPPEVAFLCSVASSVLWPHPTSHPRTCSACGLKPSRAGPARVRARVRPPRFRAKNFSTCARSSTARGSSHASRYAMGRCCLLLLRMRSAPRN
jgi:hypothetical protein